MLLRREPVDVDTAVARLVAVQAQEPASPFIALWNRVDRFDPAALRSAIDDRRLVKSPLMRITLHLLTAADYPAFHTALTPILRAARLNDKRYRSTGLTPADADAVVEPLLRFTATARSKEEINAFLAELLGEPPDDRLWWALRTCAPILRAPTDHPWGFDLTAAYRAADDRDPVDADRAVDELLLRCIEATGPATARDLARFTMLPMATIRPSIDRLVGRITVVDGPDGAPYLLAGAAPLLPDPDRSPPPRLLGMWDNLLLAHHDRRRVIDDDIRREVIRRNGDVLPTVLADGRVRGIWRVADDGIELCLLDAVADDDLAQLDGEARQLRALVLEHDPTTYRRFDRWWTQLPTRRRTVIGR